MEHKGAPDTAAPSLAKNRLLGIILAFNLAHFDPLVLIFGEYVSMCEGGWNPSLLIYTTLNWTTQVESYIQRRTFCYRTNSSLPIEFSYHNKSIGIGLSSFHRQYVADHLHMYDVFVYQEDDMVFRFAHLAAFMHESAKLVRLNVSDDHVIGFQRFRREMRQVLLYAPVSCTLLAACLLLSADC